MISISKVLTSSLNRGKEISLLEVRLFTWSQTSPFCRLFKVVQGSWYHFIRTKCWYQEICLTNELPARIKSIWSSLNVEIRYFRWSVFTPCHCDGDPAGHTQLTPDFVPPAPTLYWDWSLQRFTVRWCTGVGVDLTTQEVEKEKLCSH